MNLKEKLEEFKNQQVSITTLFEDVNISGKLIEVGVDYIVVEKSKGERKIYILRNIICITSFAIKKNQNIDLSVGKV